MKYKDPVTGEWKRTTVDITTSAKILDTLPVGTVVEYESEDGIAPEGWEIVEEKIKVPKECVVAFSTNHTISESGVEETLNFDTLVTGVHEDELEDLYNVAGVTPPLHFSPTKHAIVVTKDKLEGVTFRDLKISAFINFQTVTAGVKYVIIKLNGELVAENITYLDNRQTLVIPDVILKNCAENDEITLTVMGTQGDIIRRNMSFGRLTVEVIDETTLTLPVEEEL